VPSAGITASSRRRQAAAGPANLIANGDFSNGDVGWSGFYYSGKAPTGGKAVFTASPAYDGIEQTVTLVAGKYYELRYTVSARTSGTTFPRLLGGSNRNGVIRSTAGTFTERLLANAGNNAFNLALETGGSLSVDDISLVGPYDTATVGGA
jgi:hypothetical protein